LLERRSKFNGPPPPVVPLVDFIIRISFAAEAVPIPDASTYRMRSGFAPATIVSVSFDVDNADARSWDDATVRARVSEFIERQILAKRT